MRTPAIPRRQRRHTHRRLTEFLFRHHLVPAGDHRRRGELRLMRRSWRGVAESTRSLLQLPACRHFYLNRVDLARVATWRKLKRGAICRLKSKLNTSLGVGNRAVWKARGRGRAAAAPHGRPYTRAFFDELWPLPAVAEVYQAAVWYWLQCAVVHGGNGLIYSLWQTWLRIGSRGAAMAPCKRSRPTCHILLFRDSSVVWSC